MSFCFGCLPIVFDKLLGRVEDRSIVVVVTPVTAIMKDQVSEFYKCPANPSLQYCMPNSPLADSVHPSLLGGNLSFKRTLDCICHRTK